MDLEIGATLTPDLKLLAVIPSGENAEALLQIIKQHETESIQSRRDLDKTPRRVPDI